MRGVRGWYKGGYEGRGLEGGTRGARGRGWYDARG